MPNQDAVAQTQNVLEAMTRATFETKPQRGTRLTPVGSEVIPEPTRLPVTRAPFPNDSPTEVVEQAIVELRRQIKNLTEAADALEKEVLGRDPQAQVVAPDPKAAERAADAKHAKPTIVADPTVEGGEDPSFAADFAAKQAAAQAATFAAPKGDASPTVTDGWTCPTHGDQALKDDRSPKGREFRRCTLCKEFQKP